MGVCSMLHAYNYGPADINLKQQSIVFYERVLSHLLPFMFKVDL